MALRPLSEIYPSFRCGYVSCCMFCGKGPIWSGDGATVYLQVIEGQGYAHQDCMHEDNLKCGVYGSLRDKNEKPDWSHSALAPAHKLLCVYPILTAEEFNSLAEDTFVKDGDQINILEIMKNA